MSHNAELVKFGATLGLGENIIQQIIKSAGPLFAKVILGWLEKKLKAEPTLLKSHVSTHMLGAPVVEGIKLDFGGDFVKQFVVTLLKQYKDEILVHAQAVLGDLFDKLIDAID